jgi:hypothetical protein
VSEALIWKVGLLLAAALGGVGAWGPWAPQRARKWTALGAVVALVVVVGCWRGGEGLGAEVGVPASLWAAAAGMVALTSARFQVTASAHTVRLLWGGGVALLLGAWVSLGAVRPALPPLLAGPQAQLLALCGVAALSAGLAAAVVAVVAPTRDRQLLGEGWALSGCLVVALLLGAYGALGLSAQEPSAALLLTDPQGVSLEATVTVADLKAGRPMSAPRAMSWTPRVRASAWLPWSVLVAAACAAVGGLLGAARPRLGVAPLAFAGVAAAALGGWLLWGLPGPQPLPSPEALSQTAQQLGAGLDVLALVPPDLLPGMTTGEALQVAASRGLEGEQLLGLPTLSADAAQAQPADAAPAALLCLLAALLAFAQAVARPPAEAADRLGPSAWPASLHAFDGKLQPGLALLTARDAMQLAALLLWAGLGLCVLYSYEAAARYTLQPHQGLWLAVALTAAASTWGFERAQARADRADFALWLVLPLLTLLLALLAALLGAADQAPALRLLP